MVFVRQDYTKYKDKHISPDYTDILTDIITTALAQCGKNQVICMQTDQSAFICGFNKFWKYFGNLIKVMN